MIRMRTLAMTAVCAAALTACATVERPGAGARVTAFAETTAVSTRNADAADDPAIWSGPETTLAGRRLNAFVAGTDKKAGLYIYDLAGAVLQFLPQGLLNNVDVAALPRDEGGWVILGASDRTPGQEGIALFRFDARTGGEVEYWGRTATDIVEPYGFCMRQWRGQIHAILIGKDGQTRQLVLTEGPDGAPAAREVRRFAVGSIAEGCAIDTTWGGLFISEETVGLWRYDLDPVSGDARTLVQAADGVRLTADVEGAAILDDRTGTYLIASSQGDSAFAVWRVHGRDTEWVGRFAVHAGEGVDAVTGTDGLDAHGAFGPFGEGLIVVQDDVNPGGAQNFKYLHWADVRRALGLPDPAPR
jgi:3-phytase